METRTVETSGMTLDDLLLKIKEGGEIILTDHNHPLARVVPTKGRIPGLHPNAMRMADDFDDSLPEDLLLGKK